MTDKPKDKNFYLGRRNAGRNYSVWSLPSPPREFIDQLGWQEEDSLKMILVPKGILIVKKEVENIKERNGNV